MKYKQNIGQRNLYPDNTDEKLFKADWALSEWSACSMLVGLGASTWVILSLELPKQEESRVCREVLKSRKG